MFTQEREKDGMPKEALIRALRSYWWTWLLMAGAAGIGMHAYWTEAGETPSDAAKQGTPPSSPAVSVAAAPASRADMGVCLMGLGSVAPLSTVTVKSRVDGELVKVLFEEGQVVSKGSPLAETEWLGAWYHDRCFHPAKGRACINIKGQTETP